MATQSKRLNNMVFSHSFMTSTPAFLARADMQTLLAFNEEICDEFTDYVCADYPERARPGSKEHTELKRRLREYIALFIKPSVKNLTTKRQVVRRWRLFTPEFDELHAGYIDDIIHSIIDTKVEDAAVA